MIQKLKKNAPKYHWESAAIRAALEKREWLWVSINWGGHHVKGWYPPRIARYILCMLREAGSCDAQNEFAHRVLVAGPGEEVGLFGYYYPTKIVGLLAGLHYYHRKKARALKREVKRNEWRIHDAWLLVVLSGVQPSGSSGKPLREKPSK